MRLLLSTTDPLEMLDRLWAWSVEIILAVVTVQPAHPVSVFARCVDESRKSVGPEGVGQLGNMPYRNTV